MGGSTYVEVPKVEEVAEESATPAPAPVETPPVEAPKPAERGPLVEAPLKRPLVDVPLKRPLV